MRKNIHISPDAHLTKTLEYSEKNIKELEELGYIKSPVCKPYSRDKVIRYNPNRGVYWFCDRTAAHMSDCFFTRLNTGTLIII